MVEWIGDSYNTQLRIKYNNINSILSQIEEKIESKGCDNLEALENIIVNLRITLDNMTNGLINTASTATQKITNVVDCISTADPEIQQTTLSTMLDSANKALSGSALQSIEDEANNILNQIDNNTCDEIENQLNGLQNSANNLQNSINDALSASNSVIETDNSFAQAVGKIAALINCLNNEILQDDKLASTIETMEPSLKNVVSVASEAAQNGIPKSKILKDASKLISENLDVEGKYYYAVNKLTDLFG